MSTPIFEPDLPIARCFACSDLGFTFERGRLSDCWRIAAGAAHVAASPSSLAVRRSVTELVDQGIHVSPHLLLVARSLAFATSDRPITGRRLIELHFGHCKSPLRELHEAIETLLRVWLLPVGARKSQPPGYWVITDADEFAEWLASARSAPIRRLDTIYRVARHNFPRLAGQQNFFDTTEAHNV